MHKIIDKYNKREFMNRKGYHSVAAIHSSSCAREWEDDGYSSLVVDSYLTLSDCARQIRIDLSCSNKAEANNALYKLNKIIEHATELKEFIEYYKEHLYYKEKPPKKGAK